MWWNKNTTITDTNLRQQQNTAANDYRVTVDSVQYCVRTYCYYYNNNNNNKQVALTKHCQIIICDHQRINKTGEAES